MDAFFSNVATLALPQVHSVRTIPAAWVCMARILEAFQAQEKTGA